MQPFHCLGLEPSFINQPLANVGVVIRPKESLLETPVLQIRRGGSFFHKLEVTQGFFDAAVGEQGPLPILLEGQQTLGESVRVLFSNEIPAVLTQDLQYIGFRVPSQSAPD